MTMPAMPKVKHARRVKAMVGCACGCGMGTRSTWHPGHDGRATGWAIRIIKGVITLADVPPNERNGAMIMLDRRGLLTDLIAAGNPRPQQQAA